MNLYRATMKQIIKVTSRSFSRHPVLKQELLDIFPNSVFNTDGPPTGLPNIVDFLNNTDGMILGLEQMDRRIMQQLKNLKIIAKYGVGLDNLDLDAAKELGIAVGWTGGVNKRSASEQALGFMLGLSRNLFFSSFPLKEGRWKKEGGALLTGKTVGIIGCGNIGTDLIYLLQPFNCRVLICDVLDKSGVVDTFGVTQVTQEILLAEADIISLHVPLTELTQCLVNQLFLQKMKPTAYLINNSRGPVVKQADLKNALQQNIIAGAALDVYESEPPNDLEFLALPNLMVTPHIGGNANEAVLAMGRSAINHIKDYFINAG
jgi:phosphoglycerate dehydrogenase-like enzyme